VVGLANENSKIVKKSLKYHVRFIINIKDEFIQSKLNKDILEEINKLESLM
jgi:hypothetical protein